MLTLLASTLVPVTIWISFYRMSNRYSLKPLTRKIFSVLVFGEVNAFLFTAYIYIKMFKSSFIGVHTATVYFPFVYGGFLCAGGIIWTIAKYLRTRPEDLRSTTANIVFKNLSFEKCCCIIENISETSLYSVSVGWICKTQLSPVQIHKCGTVKAKNELSVAYHRWHRITDQTPYIDISDDFIPIIPDTL